MEMEEGGRVRSVTVEVPADGLKNAEVAWWSAITVEHGCGGCSQEPSREWRQHAMVKGE
jgi:hypothetical protein